MGDGGGHRINPHMPCSVSTLERHPAHSSRNLANGHSCVQHRNADAYCCLRGTDLAGLSAPRLRRRWWSRQHYISNCVVPSAFGLPRDVNPLLHRVRQGCPTTAVKRICVGEDGWLDIVRFGIVTSDRWTWYEGAFVIGEAAGSDDVVFVCKGDYWAAKGRRSLRDALLVRRGSVRCKVTHASAATV